MIRHMLSCLGRYKIYAILAPCIISIEVLMEILLPWVMSRIIDVGIMNGDVPYVARMGLLMIAMALIALCAGALAGRFSAVASAGLAKGIRQQEYYKIQEFSFRNIDRFTTSSLITRLTTDVNNAQTAFMTVIRTAVRSPLMLICATCMAVYINARLALIFLLAIPVLAVALYIIASIAFPRFQVMLTRYDKLNARVQENLTAIHLIKAFVREDHESEAFREAADALRLAQLRAERVIIWSSPFMQLVMYSCMIAVAWFGGNYIIAGDMLVGELMSYISYVSQILMSLMMISMIFITLVLSRASLQRICEVLDEPLDLTDGDAPAEDAAADAASVAQKDACQAETEQNTVPDEPGLQLADGSICFRDVSFRYGDDEENAENMVLRHINLSIASGQTVGILGGTGSAKTTLVQLIPRLYDATEGEVLVGGHNVREYKLCTLHDDVAMVLQKNVLFSGTIEENLRWGDANATQEELEAACKAAQAHDFIMDFPDGYQTLLGQGGAGLSGGQKQRLCIARALLKKPKVLILDDSTSAVDTATDSRIRHALRTELAGTTTITIAQRVSSVQDADLILVMDDGAIHAAGTHAELLQTDPIYQEVYYSQQRGSDAQAANPAKGVQ